MDPNAITAGLAGLKRATEIGAQLLRSATLDRSLLSLHLTEINTELADARMALLDARDELRAKDDEIARLEDALKLKGALVRGGDAYYDTSVSRSEHPDAYCPRCWEVDHRAIHLKLEKGSEWACPQCKTAILPRCLRDPRSDA